MAAPRSNLVLSDGSCFSRLQRFRMATYKPCKGFQSNPEAGIREQDALMEKGLIRIFDEFVWMSEQPDRPGQTWTSPALSGPTDRGAH